MKKFWKDNKGFIVVTLSLVFIIVCSLFIQGNSVEQVEVSADMEEWLLATSGDESVVTVIAQTTCSHCINFKPVMQAAQEKYGFKLYWFEADEMEKSDYNTLVKTFDLQSYGGTPHTFIVKGGKLVAEQSGEVSSEKLETFLKDNKVIK